MKIKDIIQIIKPTYIYLRLKPNNSIRNQTTHTLSKTISSLYRNLIQNIKREEAKVLKLLGKEFLVGTKYSLELTSKVGYFIYIEKQKVEFYFIIPSHYLSIMKEKISSVWSTVTIEQVDEIPSFSNNSKKYQLVYKKEDALSLATNRSNNDLLNSQLNIIDVLEEGDKVGVFYNFIPTSQFSWRNTYENTIHKVKKCQPVDRNKFGLSYILHVIIGIVSSITDGFGEALSDSSKNKKVHNKMTLIENAIERLNGGKQVSESTVKKANANILNTQIIILSESQNKLRQLNNARSLTQSFDVIAGDNRLIARSYNKPFQFKDHFIKGAEVNKTGDEENQNFLSLAGRELLEKYSFIDKVETQENQVPVELKKGIMHIGTSTYRGHIQNAYLSTDKEYKQLLLVLIGPTRAGKSTLIGNLSYDAIRDGECVIIFDYIKNCELSQEVSALFPKEQVLNIECNNFATLEGLGFNEVGFSEDPFIQYDNAKRQTTQLLTLVNAINTSDTSFSPKMERYLSSASLVTFIVGGSIRDVFQVLQDHNARHKFLKLVPKEQYDNLSEYMASLGELDEVDKDGYIKGTKLSLIVGIIDRLNKLKANTYMELMLKKSTKNNINLVEELQKNQLICIKMPEHMFPTDGERDVYTTYWISKLWLALQERARQIPDRNKLRKVNLIFDELYQVENTEIFLKDKLSRLAKFGLKPIISCHYLNQIKHIREELRSANASYMLISGCDKKNFDELKEELYPFVHEDLLNLKRWHSMNLIKCRDGYGKFITRLPLPVEDRKKAYEKLVTNLTSILRMK